MEGCIGFGFAAIAFSVGVLMRVRSCYNGAYGLIRSLGQRTWLAARSFIRSFVYRKVYSISLPEQSSRYQLLRSKDDGILSRAEFGALVVSMVFRIGLKRLAGTFQEVKSINLLTSACLTAVRYQVVVFGLSVTYGPCTL
jgi:hypothetical protein